MSGRSLQRSRCTHTCGMLHNRVRCEAGTRDAPEGDRRALLAAHSSWAGVSPALGRAGARSARQRRQGKGNCPKKNPKRSDEAQGACTVGRCRSTPRAAQPSAPRCAGPRHTAGFGGFLLNKYFLGFRFLLFSERHQLACPGSFPAGVERDQALWGHRLPHLLAGRGFIMPHPSGASLGFIRGRCRPLGVVPWCCSPSRTSSLSPRGSHIDGDTATRLGPH